MMHMCSGSGHGQLPAWMSAFLEVSVVVDACRNGYRHGARFAALRRFGRGAQQLAGHSSVWGDGEAAQEEEQPEGEHDVGLSKLDPDPGEIPSGWADKAPVKKALAQSDATAAKGAVNRVGLGGPAASKHAFFGYGAGRRRAM